MSQTTMSVAVPLRKALHKSRRGRRLASMLLIAPLGVYIAAFFLLPIGMMFYRAVANPEMHDAFPRTSEALLEWKPRDGNEMPPGAVMDVFADELKHAYGSREIGEAARRLNYESSGFRTLLMKTSRELANGREAEAAATPNWMMTATPSSPASAASANSGAGPEALPRKNQKMVDLDAQWARPSTWLAMRRAAPHFTPYYLLAAVDLRLNDTGAIERVPPDQSVYLAILARTLKIAAVVTGICLLLGYAYAALMVKASRGFAFALLVAVMLPFWTSLLARTTAWIVVLQENGLVNEALMALHLISRPLTLVFNATGLYIVMIHIMLPFTVLPVYTSMKAIPPHYMRASASLGAHPLRGFLRVYLPMTMPGVGAGALLTFIITIGYYITPSLVASAQEQMLGYFISFYANTTVNWGMASALGIVLLACVCLIYAIAARTVGVRQIAGLR